MFEAILGLFNLLSHPKSRLYCYSHLTDGETEARSDWGTCPSWQGWNLPPEPKSRSVSRVEPHLISFKDSVSNLPALALISPPRCGNAVRPSLKITPSHLRPNGHSLLRAPIYAPLRSRHKRPALPTPSPDPRGHCSDPHHSLASPFLELLINGNDGSSFMSGHFHSASVRSI